MQNGFQKILSQQTHEHDSDCDDDGASIASSTESPDGYTGSDDDVLNAVQELRLIHRPQTGNFLVSPRPFFFKRS